MSDTWVRFAVAALSAEVTAQGRDGDACARAAARADEMLSLLEERFGPESGTPSESELEPESSPSGSASFREHSGSSESSDRRPRDTQPAPPLDTTTPPRLTVSRAELKFTETLGAAVARNLWELENNGGVLEVAVREFMDPSSGVLTSAPSNRTPKNTF
jgi:hypothetical protein